MPRPDLAMMTFDLTTSGVVRNALRIAGAAAEAGMRVEVWTAREGGEMRALVPANVHVRGFGAAVPPIYSREERKASALAAVPAFASALAELSPRIACSAGNHFHEVAVRARRASGTAAELRLIGRVSNALPRFSWKPARLPGSLWKRVAARRRFAAMDRLVAVTNSLAADLQHHLLLASEKIVVIPNGIDLADARRRAAASLDHPWFEHAAPPVVLGVGRLVPQKNFAALIRAFASARKSKPMRLLLIGDGPDREDLQGLTRELGVEADVQFAGFIDDPMPYYARAALFVLPSRWEGMSNALLEAMAVGCPVLATRCSGTSEVLGTGSDHRLVAVGDERRLADGIVRMLADPDAGAGLRQRVSQYDLGRTLQAYVDLFEQQLAEPRGGSGD